MDYLIAQLNSEKYLSILKSYDLDVDGGEFEFDKEVDIAYLKDYIPLLVQLGTQLGLPLSKKHLYEITGAPKPENIADTIQLYPVLGQQESNEPDEEDGQTAKPNPPAGKKLKKPVRAALAAAQGLSAAEVQAIVKDNLQAAFADFFGPARS